jgi:trans-2,3-dihydro-3-hydroxyanthranilate isomerase
VSHGFHILDVFARGLYSGNQLAVVLEADDLDTDTMQAVALETNFSETTFVTSGTDDGGAYRVRIFTPTQELPFAGHPTLGTAWLIRHLLHDEPPDRVELELELGIGRVPVDFEGTQRESLGFLRAPAATFGQCLAAQEIAPALCLNAEDFSTAAPIQQVTAGLEFIVAPLASRDALSRCALQKGPLDDLENAGSVRSSMFSARSRSTRRTKSPLGSSSKPTECARIPLPVARQEHWDTILWSIDSSTAQGSLSG